MTKLLCIQVHDVLLPLFWCLCMAITISVQYNGVFLPDIILAIDPMLLTSGNPFNPIECFSRYSRSSHLNGLTRYPPDWMDDQKL